MVRKETKYYVGELCGVLDGDKVHVWGDYKENSLAAPLADLGELVDALRGCDAPAAEDEALRHAAETAQSREELVAVVEAVPWLVRRLQTQRCEIRGLQEALRAVRQAPEVGG